MGSGYGGKMDKVRSLLKNFFTDKFVLMQRFAGTGSMEDYNGQNHGGDSQL